MASESVLHRLETKIQQYNKSFDIPISIWGNTAKDNLLYNYKYNNASYAFRDNCEGASYEPRVVLIFGPINKKQLKRMKLKLEQWSSKPFIVFVHGPLKSKIKSPYLVADIRNHIKIDLEYHKSPVDLEELFHLLLGLLRGNYDKS